LEKRQWAGMALEQITVIAAMTSKVRQSIALQEEWIAFVGGPAR
jgi:hypothetical protein